MRVTQKSILVRLLLDSKEGNAHANTNADTAADTAAHANINQTEPPDLHSHKTLGTVLFYDHSPYVLGLVIQSR